MIKTEYDNFKFNKAFVGDVEVYRDYFLIVLADINENLLIDADEHSFKYTYIDSRMDNWEQLLRDTLYENLFIGFNTKSYDNNIIRFIAGVNRRYPYVGKCDLTALKEYSDYLINASEREVKNFNTTFFYSLDIRSEGGLGINLSLKDIEYYLNLDIITEDESFDINVSKDGLKLEKILRYCKHDVYTTYLLIKHSLNSEKGLANFENKLTSADLTLTRMKQRNEPVDFDVARKIVAGKSATIAAKMFETKTDGKYELWYKVNNKPQIVKPRTPIALEIYNKRSKDIFFHIDNFKLGNVTLNFAKGGLHTINSDDTPLEIYKNVYNFDVASFYPSFIEKYTKIANFNLVLYKELKKERLILKKKKDKDSQAKQTAYKLMINATSGKYNEIWRNNRIEDNPLYNPHVYYAMTTSCQLMLLDLAESLNDVVRIVQLNTDGIAFTVNDSDSLKKARDICKDWEDWFGYELEESYFDLFIQASVNDYIGVYHKENEIKCKSKGASFKDLSEFSASADFVSNILNQVFRQYDKDYLDFELISKIIDNTVDEMIKANDFKSLQVNLKAVSNVKDKGIYNNGNVLGERSKALRGFIVNKSYDTVKVKSNQLKIEETAINVTKSSGNESVKRVKATNELDTYLDIKLHNKRVSKDDKIDYNANAYKIICKRALLDMMKEDYIITKNDDNYNIKIVKLNNKGVS